MLCSSFYARFKFFSPQLSCVPRYAFASDVQQFVEVLHSGTSGKPGKPRSAMRVARVNQANSLAASCPFGEPPIENRKRERLAGLDVVKTLTDSSSSSSSSSWSSLFSRTNGQSLIRRSISPTAPASREGVYWINLYAGRATRPPEGDLLLRRKPGLLLSSTFGLEM